MREEILSKFMPITDEERVILERGEIDKNLYMEGEKNVINSKKLLAEGKLITARPHTRFIHFPIHTHDYIEVIYMCQGSTTHIINGEKLTLNAGELLFLPQNARQEILPADEGDIAVNFIILPDFFDKTLEMLRDEKTPLKTFIIDCLGQKSKTSFLHFAVADVVPVQNLVENLLWTLINGAPNKRKINQTTMGLLFLQLINYTDRLSYMNEDDDLILKVLQYIERNYKNATLSELAHELHYDEAWLSREIKRKTGKNYTELLQNKRLSQAEYLLKNTDIKVDDIAFRVGYENISYFHRIFYKSFGTTPKKFRDMS